MGLPSLARDVGGVSSAVQDGRNGFLFPASAPASAYVERIRQLLDDPSAYEQLARSSHDEFSNRLNWDTTGAALCDLLRELS
jgi:glycosyltransferase involved in cell wall biosynthesis